MKPSSLTALTVGSGPDLAGYVLLFHIVTKQAVFHLGDSDDRHDLRLSFCDVAGHMDAAGGCVGKGMGNAASVTDDVKTGIAGF